MYCVLPDGTVLQEVPRLDDATVNTVSMASHSTPSTHSTSSKMLAFAVRKFLDTYCFAESATDSIEPDQEGG